MYMYIAVKLHYLILHYITCKEMACGRKHGFPSLTASPTVSLSVILNNAVESMLTSERSVFVVEQS